MKKDIAMQWVAALRSGKYKQEVGVLKGPNGFCCLGVLCDISKQGVWAAGAYQASERDFEFAILPLKVQEWAGLKTTNGYLKRSFKKQRSLADLNDNIKMKNFSVIIKYIEKHYEDL